MHSYFLSFQQRVLETFKVLKCRYGSFCFCSHLLLPSHYCRGYLGLLMCLIAAIVSSVCLDPYPLLHGLHPQREYKGLLRCLNAATVFSVNLGSHPHLILFALLQRVLETANELTIAVVPSIRVGTRSHILPLHCHGGYMGLLMCLNASTDP